MCSNSSSCERQGRCSYFREVLQHTAAGHHRQQLQPTFWVHLGSCCVLWDGSWQHCIKKQQQQQLVPATTAVI
jgi:hypothetical protein